jgi:hypothetical protein
MRQPQNRKSWIFSYSQIANLPISHLCQSRFAQIRKFFTIERNLFLKVSIFLALSWQIRLEFSSKVCSSEFF